MAGSCGGSISGSPREDRPLEPVLPPRGEPGLTRLHSRSKQSLFSLVPKLMMPWGGEIQRQDEHGKGRPLEAEEAASRSCLQPTLLATPPSLGPAVPSTQLPDPIFPFLKLCLNAISSRKPSPKPTWMESFLLLNPEALYLSPFRALARFCPGHRDCCACFICPTRR